MKCKNCGEEMPEPPQKVVVTEKIREVHLSEGVYWVRVAMCVASVLVVMILAGAGVDVLDRMRDMKAMSEPSIKIEVTEFDYSGRPTKKLTR